MHSVLLSLGRAPVAFGRRAVPQLFEEVRRPGAERKLRALTSLCDLVHEPERLYQTINCVFLDYLKALLKDEHPLVRSKTCELLHQVTIHSIGRKALLNNFFLPHLAELLDDPLATCRINVHLVLNSLAQMPEGAEALGSLIPKVILKLRQDENNDKEEQLLLSTLSHCSRFNALPALALDGVNLLYQKLSHTSPNIRREASSALMELSVPLEGKRQICEYVLPILVDLLKHQDVDVQTNVVGVIMNTVIITPAKYKCLELKVIPILLHLLAARNSQRRPEKDEKKALILYTLRTLTALAEAPEGRLILLEELTLLRQIEEEDEDPDIQEDARIAIKVITWTP